MFVAVLGNPGSESARIRALTLLFSALDRGDPLAPLQLFSHFSLLDIAMQMFSLLEFPLKVMSSYFASFLRFLDSTKQ